MTPRSVHFQGRDGVRLYCRLHGTGPNTLLCLPGLVRTGRDFEPLLARLPANWRALCPDYRGRGGSARDPRPARYHHATYVRDSEQLLEQLGASSVTVLGNSFGGWVAMSLALRQAKRVSGLILNDIGPTVPRQAALRYMAFVARHGDPESIDPAVLAQLRRAHRWSRFIYPLCRLGLMRHSAPVVTGFEATFRALDLPMLVLRGARSKVLTPLIGEQMRRDQPGLEWVTVPAAGHHPRLDEPEAVAAIRAFLDRVSDAET
jgi:pimeloyl-ACP methyl ester carboxylesterase